jgi:hypothetical protein
MSAPVISRTRRSCGAGVGDPQVGVAVGVEQQVQEGGVGEGDAGSIQDYPLVLRGRGQRWASRPIESRS